MRDLGAFPVTDAIDVLVAGLCDEPPVADAAVHSLVRIGGEGVARAVVPLLSHPETRPRSAALDVLLGLGNAAGPVLVELLDHPDRELRKMAAEVLAESRYTGACEPLCQHLSDPDPVVRAAVAAAVGALGCPGAAGKLLLALVREEEEWVRFALAGAVARIGSQEEVAALRRLVPPGALADLVNRELAHRREEMGEEQAT